MTRVWQKGDRAIWNYCGDDECAQPPVLVDVLSAGPDGGRIHHTPGAQLVEIREPGPEAPVWCVTELELTYVEPGSVAAAESDFTVLGPEHAECVAGFQLLRDGMLGHLQRLVIMAGGSWDQDRVEECVEEAAARLRELRAKEDAQCDADERLVKALDERDAARDEVVKLGKRIDNLQRDWSESAMASSLAAGYHAIADFMCQRDEARAEVVRLGQELEQWPTSTVVSGEAEPDLCGAIEGATGIRCSLIRWHSLDVEHEGTASPDQEKSVGTPLFVRWPWNEYDRDWAALQCSPDLLIREGTRG